MADDVSIREATEADAGAIHDAIRAMGVHVGTPDKIRSTADDLSHHGLAPGKAFEGMIAEIDGAFAGMALFFPSFSTWLGKPGVYVQDLFVGETFRGRGVGEALVAAVAARAATRGAVYLRLSVDIANVSAQAFYSSLGMGWSESERVYAAYHEAFQRLAGTLEEGGA